MGVKERKERERLRMRHDIVEAAEKIFFSEGISKATMDSIAALAEVSKTTLYTFFKSKNDLILAIQLKGQEIRHAMSLKVINSKKETMAAIQDVLYTNIEFYEKYPSHFDLKQYVNSNSIKFDEENEGYKRYVELSNESLRLWNDLIEKGKAEGRIRADINPLNVGILSWIQINALLTSNCILDAIETEFKITKKDLFDDFFKLFFLGIQQS